MPGKAYGHRLRRGRVSEAGRIYLITVVCRDREPVFRNWDNGRCFVGALRRSAQQADTLCFVVMPDHAHWLMQLRDGAELSATVQKVKSLTTKCLGYRRIEGEPAWQKGFHDHALRTDEDVQNVARYVVANPLRAGIVTSLADYPLWDAIWL